MLYQAQEIPHQTLEVGGMIDEGKKKDVLSRDEESNVKGGIPYEEPIVTDIDATKWACGGGGENTSAGGCGGGADNSGAGGCGGGADNTGGSGAVDVIGTSPYSKSL